MWKKLYSCCDLVIHFLNAFKKFCYFPNGIYSKIDNNANKQNNIADNKSETSAPFTKLPLYRSSRKQEHYKSFAAAYCEANCLFLMPNESL